MRLRSQFLISLVVFALVITAIISSVFLTNLSLVNLRHERDVANEVEIDASALSYASMDYFLYEQNLTNWQSMVSVLSSEISSLNSTNTQQQTLVTRVLVDLQDTNQSFNNIITLESTPLNDTSSGIPKFETMWDAVAGKIQLLSSDSENYQTGWNSKQTTYTKLV